jgi:hypothetical protein
VGSDAHRTMTNATVAQMVKGVSGDEITLKYKDGEKKIHVAPDTTIVTYVPGDKSELKPGAKIFIVAANKKEDGTLEAPVISVGRETASPHQCKQAAARASGRNAAAGADRVVERSADCSLHGDRMARR